MAVAAAAVAAGRQRGVGSSSRPLNSATPAGMARAAAATAMLRLHAAAVVMKTPAATAIAGSQTTINNQLKAAMAMETEMATITAMTMMMETKATAAVEARRQRGGNSQLGGRGGSLAEAQLWWQWQWVGKRGNSLRNLKLNSSFGLLAGIKHK